MTPPLLRVAVVARAVMPFHGLGGLERHVFDLARHLAMRGVEVTLITPPPRAGWTQGSSDPFTPLGVHVRHVPYVTFPFANRRGTTIVDRSTAYPVFGWRAGRLALSLARAGGVDIVHGLGASVLGYAMAGRRPAPLVFNPQGLEEFGASATSQSWAKRAGYAPLRAAVRRCARAADVIIATDRALAPVVERHLHPRPGQMRVLPNALDLATADRLAGRDDGRRIRADHGIAEDEFVLLSVGRLETNKGFDVLAEAIGRVAAATGALHDRAWRWVLVGVGPARNDIERAATRHGIADRTVFAGRAAERDLHAWYEAAALFVHPTRYEGSSIVTLEAMAHKKAVVATRAGGLPDKVRPGVNGWLVEPGDAEALARALTDAVSDLPRLAAMGLESRVIVERDFSWAAIVEKQIAMYLELTGRT